MISHYSIKLRQVSLISLLALLLISVIGAAMADTTPMKPSNAPYQLSDLDKASAAPLQIMTPAVSAVMTDTVPLSDPLAVASVPAISSEVGSTADETPEPELLSKTTLSPGVTIDGLACNILHTPIGKHRWSILQYDLSLDTDNQTAVFVSDEDTTIQSVSCSADGSQVLMAIQDGVGGDSEIYLIDQTNNEILRLTDNDTDDLDVSMSQDGRVITWQGRLADDRKAVFVRTIAEDGSYSDIALGSKYPMTQPSLSDNGEWLILVNERNRQHVLRYQLSTGEFTTLGIVYTRLFNIDVVDPSISNDGTKALWGEEYWYQWLILTDLTKNTSERLFKISHADQHVLEHPMLSGDGEAAIYSINAPNKRQTFMRVLRTGSTYRLGKVLRAENQYLGNQLSAVVDIETHSIKVLAANGVVNVFPESEEGYKEGDSITLTAVADSGYVFESWESVGGECSGEQTTCSFVMPQNNVEVTANFKVLVKVNAIGIAGHDLAVLEDGTLMHWDSGVYSSPTPPNGLTDVVAVSTSGDHSVALKSDGTIVGWGEYAGYSGLHNWSEDSPVKDAVAVATGYNTTVILFADGTAKGYGIGGSDVPEGLSDVVAVAGGYESSVVLKSDGTVNSWGNSLLKVPEDWSGIAAISTNLDSSIMALKRDGTIVYSSPTYQDPGAVPAELNDAVAIAGAGRTAVVLRNNGTIVTWSEGIISVLWEGDEEIVAITPSLALTSGGRVIGLRGNFVPPELALD